VDSRFLNTIYIRARKEVDDKVKFEEIDRLIGSDFSENYNPLLDFIEKNKNYSFSNEIEKLCNSINSIQNFDYKYLFIRKFMVGIISSIYGDPSPLCLVLCGGQNSGKTTFWNNLLPSELHSYYAESKLDSNKPTDDELLMTQKLLIMDDEFGGKNKTEAKRLKELTSKRAFTLREPYGRKNVTIPRVAVLCGTSNERQILNDPTGNRRIIPLEVISFDFQLLNSIDRISLFMEAVYWYNEGVTYHTNKEEIAYLNGNTQQFEQIRPEQELLQRYFRNPVDGESASFMSAMDIKVYLEKATQQRIILPKLVFELEQLNYMRIQKEGRTGYNVRLTEYDYAIESRVAPF
jgi:predicted P-loop ATPase